MVSRIVSNPNILGGKPCIKNSRISVEFILELFASGASYEDILKAYPYLNQEDIIDTFRYASQFLKNEVVLMAEVVS